MKRLERLQAIILYLQSKKTATSAEIANHFEVSARTIIRDMRALEAAGVPIGAEAGLGYFLSDSYHLPPIMFTAEEATALLLGSKLVTQMSDKNTGNAFESALMKIKSILKSNEQEKLDTLNSQIAVLDHSQQNIKNRRDFLGYIQNALLNKQQIEIEYYSLHSNSNNRRNCEPIGLTFYGGNWHMIAFCNLRSRYRDFRVDRIQTLKPLNSHFKETKHISLDKYFDKFQNTGGELKQVILLGKKESLRFINDSKYWYGFTHQKEFDEQYMKLYFRNSDLLGLAKWIMLGGENVIVKEPDELKSIIKTLVQKLKNQYL